MLQQTRVETVLPYYERFLARFPSLETLASADEQDVLREWSGLGYYARARNLKRAAEQIVRDHDGALPRDPAQLRALPGVGRYTLGALRSIAFGQRAAVVDGNVRRVLSRLVAAPSLSQDALWSLAEELVPRSQPGDWNQALMELGAAVCTAHGPSCESCPLAASCAARRSGRPEAYPARRARPAPREVSAIAGVLARTRPEAAILMLRRPSRGLLGGLWEIPTGEGDDAGALAEALAARTGLHAEPGEALGELRHVFSHRALTLRLVRLRRLSGRMRSSAADARWCAHDEARRLPLSALMRKALKLAGVPA